MTTQAPETMAPVQVVQKLDQLASGMDKLGSELAAVRVELEPCERIHDDFVADYVAGLWDKHVAGEIKKWPGEDVRLALARRAMDTQTRGKYARLKNLERRIQEAIARTKEEIGAYRSILSAQKEGLI